MKINSLLVIVIVFVLSAGCVTNSYFLSPSNAASTPYHEVPVQSDSLRHAEYLGLLFTYGNENSQWRDNLIAGQIRFHRTNQFGIFQGYYGANLTLGDYHVAGYHLSPYVNQRFDSIYYTAKSSNQFFGDYGLNGGINIVSSFPGGGEWRIIGTEFSLWREFGNYYIYRKNLPDTAANVIFQNNLTGTLGLYTDFVAKSRQGVRIGYKLGWGVLLNPESDYSKAYYSGTINPIIYITNTVHVSTEKYSGFLQLNISSFHAINLQLGTAFHLDKIVR